MSGEANDSEFVELNIPAAEIPADTVVIEDKPADDAAEKPEGEEIDTDQGDENAGDDEGEEKPLRDDKGKFKNSAQARIDELIRRAAEAERRAARAEAVAAASRPNADAPAKPTADQFEDYAEFTEALADWKFDQRVREASTENAKRASAERETEIGNAWNAKVEAAAIADYDEVVGKSELPVFDHVRDAMYEADKGPELAMHLAQNPEVLDRLNAMSGPKAAMELARIESTLTGKAVRTSNAPAPITPVRPGSSATRNPEKMTQGEYNEWRRKELAKG